MFKQCTIGGIAVAVFAVSQVVAADDDSGFYVGLGAGESRNEAGDFQFNATLVKAFAGYAINEYLTAEVAYLDPEQANDTVDSVLATVDNRGVILSAIASAPLTERWSIFGKLGWAFYDVDQTIATNNISLSESESDDDLVWGLGTAVRIGQRWHMRLEYEAVEVSADAFDSVALSAAFRF